MKTSNINVHDMLSVWSVEEVEKHLSEVPGVESVTVNFAAGSATVRYDETHIDAADIKSVVRQKSYESDAPDASAGKPTEAKAKTPGTPPVVKPPEEKTKAPDVKPPEEKDKAETKQPASDKKEENPVGHKMDEMPKNKA